MRRAALLVSLTFGLLACTSLLGDFSVEPGDGAGGPDGGGGDGAIAEGSTPDDSGATDAPADAPIELPQPVPLVVAASSIATCATVVYLRGQPNERAVSFCWGASGDSPGFLGAAPNDPTYDGYARPRLPNTNPIQYLTFDQLSANARGLAFLGRIAPNQPGGQASPVCWGGNSQAECGQPAGGSGGGPVIPPTVLVQPDKNGIRMNSGSLAPYHGCLTMNGALFCWGQNNYCEVRSGDTSECNKSDPQNPFVRVIENQMSGPIGGPQNGPPTLLYERFAGGTDHSCAIYRKTSSTVAAVACWGRNNDNQTGLTGKPFTESPYEVPGTATQQGAGELELSSGASHTCAIVSKSQLVCWGKNDKGQAAPGGADPLGPQAVALPGGFGGSLTGLALGGDMSCFIASAAGLSRAVCYGDKSAPLGRAAGDVNEDFAFVDGLKDIVQIAVGGGHACAIARGLTQGPNTPHSLFCWGKNDRRQIAPGSAIPVFPTPHRVVFPTSPQ